MAQRALVRYEKPGACDVDSVVSTTEEWVRLYIALRRVNPPGTRLTANVLTQWKTKVTSSTTIKRKCFLVETAALDALPKYPPDLDKWIIPKDQLVLPADIYTEGMLIIDDGYDRAKLNVPRVLHIECAARWSQQRAAQPFAGRSSGSRDECLSEPEASASCPTVRRQFSPVPLQSGEQEEAAVDPLEQESPEKAMQNIIGNAVKAVQEQRWVSVDQSQPNTLEFWLRIFTRHMQHYAKPPSDWTETEKAFVKYITRECLQSKVGAALDGIVPHLKTLADMAPDHIPLLATAICKLRPADFKADATAEASESSFHAWLREKVPLGQVQFLYGSALYQAFLKNRFAQQLDLAKRKPAERGETIRILLESVTLGPAEHVGLVFAQTVDDEGKTLPEKLRFVWCTPKADELLAEWSLKGKFEQYLVFHEEAGRKSWEGLGLQSLKGTFATLRAEKVAAKDIPNVILQSLYDEFLRIHKSPCEALSQCFDEQAQHRILRARPAPAAEEEAAAPMANVDLSDAEVLALAKEMHQTWSAAVGKNRRAHACLPWVLSSIVCRRKRERPRRTRTRPRRRWTARRKASRATARRARRARARRARRAMARRARRARARRAGSRLRPLQRLGQR